VTPSRPWWVGQLIAGAVLLIATLVSYTLASLSGGSGMTGTLQSGVLVPSISGSVNSFYIFPGLALSLGVNGLVLARRRPAAVRPVDRVVLLVEGALLILVIVASVAESLMRVPGLELLAVGFLAALILWPLLIVTAVVALVTLATGNAALRRPAPVEGSP